MTQVHSHASIRSETRDTKGFKMKRDNVSVLANHLTDVSTEDSLRESCRSLTHGPHLSAAFVHNESDLVFTKANLFGLVPLFDVV